MVWKRPKRRLGGHWCALRKRVSSKPVVVHLLNLKKRKYPKCVPRSKAKSMTAAQRKSAVTRKRAKPQGVGGKPTNVKNIC